MEKNCNKYDSQGQVFGRNLTSEKRGLNGENEERENGGSGYKMKEGWSSGAVD